MLTYKQLRAFRSVYSLTIYWIFKDSKAKSLPQGANSFMIEKGVKKNGNKIREGRFSECDD